MSIDYGIVVEGKFRLSLDSGESKIMLPGDMSEYLHDTLCCSLVDDNVHNRRQQGLYAQVEEP